MVRTLRRQKIARWFMGAMASWLIFLHIGPAFGYARQQDLQHQALLQAIELRTELPKGLTQTPGPAFRQKIAEIQAARQTKTVADVRPLSLSEMKQFRGAGTLRNPYFDGEPMGYQKSFHDVNVCNGNLFKSYTDIQVSPARGAGLVLQRTYNSNDARIGPFGVGWTHAYDIQMEEDANVQAESGNSGAAPVDNSVENPSDSINLVPRTDFFGHKAVYHRDADGLYTPPTYCYDVLNSDYDTTLVNGPTAVMDDSDYSMDGTVKHYTNVVTEANGTEGGERDCDYIQDRHGNRTVLTYGLSITQADGSTRKLLTEVTDPSGRSLTFTWTNLNSSNPSEPAWRITEVTGPTYSVVYGYYTNTTSSNAANELYNLETVTIDPGDSTHLNRTTTYTYTGITGTDSNGNSDTENGLLASVTDPLGKVTTYTYAAHYNDINLAHDRFTFTGYTFTNTVWVLSVNEPAGVNGDGTSRCDTWTMGTIGQNTVIGDSDSIFMIFYYDDWLRIGYFVNGKSGEDAGEYAGEGEEGYWQFVYGYDSFNNEDFCETSETSPPSPAHSPGGIPDFGGGYIDNWTYDTHGSKTSHYVTNFPGTESTTYYDSDKYFQKATDTDMDGNVTTTDYYTDSDTYIGNRGEVKTVQDALYGTSGAEYSYTYNQYGQKASETNLNGTVTQYTYGDQWGNLTQVVQDPGDSSHLNRTTTMTYDVNGHVLTSTDPNGRATTFTYNVLGQPLTVTTPDMPGTPGETISYTYDAGGRTTSVTDHRGTTNIGYTPNSDWVQSVSDPVTGTVSYTYGITGERLSMVLPDNRTWTYVYSDPWTGSYAISGDDPDKVHLSLISIIDDQGREVDYSSLTTGMLTYAASDYAYYTGGGMASELCTSYLQQGPTYIGDYSRPWLKQVSQTQYRYSSNGSLSYALTPYQNTYTYDDTGNRLTNAVSNQQVDGSGNPVTDNYGHPIFNTRTETYAYDPLNRLSSVNYGDGETQSYAFDNMGNRTGLAETVSGSTTNTGYTYDAANRLLSTSTNSESANAYTNDADGNTLTGGGRSEVWDSQNRLVSCTMNGTTVTYDYGYDGLRRSMTVGGVTTDYVYDGQNCVEEMQPSGTGSTLVTTAEYLTGPRGPEYKWNLQTGTLRWYVYDGLGSVVGEVDPNGNYTASSEYDVYGNVRATTGTRTTSHGFVGSLGHFSDSATNLIYMRARYYDPSTGRWISEDPNRHGQNWFNYCDDDPVNEIDATGKDPGTVGQDIVSLIVDILALGGLNYEGVSAALLGKSYYNAICWVQAKSAEIMAGIDAEAEVAAIEVGQGDGETAEGDDLDGDANVLGGGLDAIDAAKQEATAVALGSVLAYLQGCDDAS